MRNLFWVDLEMTGLDTATCGIIEAAVIVTDSKLQSLEEYHQIVFQPPHVMAAMDPWCVETHGKSGLTAQIPNGRPIEKVEADLIALTGRHFGNEKIILCGNSVGTDKRFLEAGMPKFAKHLHYRVVDVSSFKEIFHSFYGISFEKKESHRALDDIRESIAELAHYLQYVKKP
jgi:oligoribonuclease